MKDDPIIVVGGGLGGAATAAALGRKGGVGRLPAMFNTLGDPM